MFTQEYEKDLQIDLYKWLCSVSSRLSTKYPKVRFCIGIYLNLLNSSILRKLCVLSGKIFHIFQKLQWRMFTNCKICILFWYESNKPSLFKIQSSPSKNRKGFFDKTTIVQFKKTIWRVINHTQFKSRAETYYPVCIWTFVGVFLHLYFLQSNFCLAILIWKPTLHCVHSLANPSAACQECFELLDVSISSNCPCSNT